MDKKNLQQWERFLTPEILRLNLTMASLFIVTFERLKTSIIERIRDFYTCGFDQNGEIVDSEYQTKVLSKNSSPLYASLEWLRDAHAISDDDIKIFNEIKKLRNSIAHEIDKMIIDGLPSKLVDYFHEMVNLLDKIEKWWIINVEIQLDPEFAGVEVDEDEIVPGPVASIRMMVDVALGSDEEASFYIEELKKQGFWGLDH